MTRSLLSVTGDDRVHFLQGILTQDVSRLAAEKIQFAALLSPQGKILHDMFLIDAGDAILIDTDAALAPTLLKRLTMYKLRAKVALGMRDWGLGIGEVTVLPDPRHKDLPHRNYSNPESLIPNPYFPELGRDFAPDTITALDAGYDLLNAVSFTKGCYVGQEITARMHYKNIARKGFFILEREGKPERLALLKFEDVYPASSTQHPAPILVDNTTYTPHLPDWMAPKLAQFREGTK